MNTQNERPSFAVLVPTLNAGTRWFEWISALEAQTCRPSRVLVLDSASTDQTVPAALVAGFDVVPISRQRFSHGGTRRLGVGLLERSVKFIVLLTQDAVLADNKGLEKLLGVFADPQVGAAYGRQLPSRVADELAAHARLFNYPALSRTTTLDNRAEIGIKTCFISNSFAAYRLDDLHSVGGFPSNVILGEDTSVAARLLMAGKAVRYQADACVYHSHNYTALEEFRRYFDTGVFHARERWLLNSFGAASGEGLRFVKSEMRYLLNHAPRLIPNALLRTGLKLVGYRMGRAEERLPVRLKRRLSMFKGFWGEENARPKVTEQNGR